MANLHYGASLMLEFHPSIFFNDKPAQKVSSQKHLGLILDVSLWFDEH